MAGTPIIVNVTGGLQDQCGFKYKNKFVTHKDYLEIKSFHDDKKWKDNPDLTWGDWVKPVWPATRSLQGSIPTPYIYDDRCRFDDVADRIKEFYDMGPEKRQACGLNGHQFVMDKDVMMSVKAMSDNFIEQMDKAFEMWKPRKQFNLFKV